VSIAADVPDAAKAQGRRSEGRPEGRQLGDLEGPADNTGKELLAKDAVADDKFLGGVNFYVKGVEGKVPGGDKK
jgi:basic membrane protein A